MGGIFINYRVVDNPLGAAAIYDRLAAHFGADKVFRDCLSIAPGSKYPEAIREALRKSSVVISVIGPQWLTLTDDTTGIRLIDREHDWVRRELVMALQLGLPVLPVLLTDTGSTGGAVPLRPQELPADLRALAVVQACELSQLRMTADLDRLIEQVTQLCPALRNGSALPTPVEDMTPAPQRTRTVPRRQPEWQHQARQQPPNAAAQQDIFFLLVNALDAMPVMRTEDGRSTLIDQLRPEISGAVRYSTQRRMQAMHILRACCDHYGGVSDLIRAIADLDGKDSLALRDFATLALLLPPEVTD